MMAPEPDEAYFTPKATADQKDEAKMQWRHWATEALKLMGANNRINAEQLTDAVATVADMMLVHWDARFNDPPILAMSEDEEEEQDDRSHQERRGGGRRR